MSGFVYTKGGPTSQQGSTGPTPVDYSAQAREQLAPLWRNLAAPLVKVAGGVADVANLGVRAAAGPLAGMSLPGGTSVVDLLQMLGESKGIPTSGAGVEQALTRKLPADYQQVLQQPNFLQDVLQRVAHEVPMAAATSGGSLLGGARALGSFIPGKTVAAGAKSLGASETVQNLLDIGTTIGTAFYPGMRSSVIKKAATEKAEGLTSQAHELGQMMPYETAPLSKAFEGLHAEAKTIPQTDAAKHLEQAEDILLGIDRKALTEAHALESFEVEQKIRKLEAKHGVAVKKAEANIEELQRQHPINVSEWKKQRIPLYNQAEAIGSKHIVDASVLKNIVEKYGEEVHDLPTGYDVRALKNIMKIDRILDIPKDGNISLNKAVKAKKVLNSWLEYSKGAEASIYGRASHDISEFIAKQAKDIPEFKKPFYKAEEFTKKIGTSPKFPTIKELAPKPEIPLKPLLDVRKPTATTVSNAINAETYLEDIINKTDNEKAIKLYNNALDKVHEVIQHGTDINKAFAESYLPGKSIEKGLAARNPVTRMLESKAGKEIVRDAPLVAPLIKYGLQMVTGISIGFPKLIGGLMIPLTAKEVSTAIDLVRTSPEIRSLIGQLATQSVRKNIPAAIETLKTIGELSKAKQTQASQQGAFVFTKQ
jgi:hypothetical protein